MGKPRMIILIRHAQSEGNKNRDIHQMIPDHRVKLTQDGWAQAEEAGRRLRTMLRPDDTLQFFTSPYRRTRETTEGILRTLTSDEQTPSPFPRHTIKVYEEPRLREQDFGNFQPCSAEMERMWQERADYGHFFYRIPNGESAADAYDRVSGFNESLWRSFSEKDFPSVCVLVTHGLMTRVFLMKWYHWSVEYFEDLRNVNHTEFIIMKQNHESGKYVLQNELRTWSELKRRAAAENPSLAASKPANVPARRWGGCANGCKHNEIDYPRRAKRQNTQDFMQVAEEGVPAVKVPAAEKEDTPLDTAQVHNVQLTKQNGVTPANTAESGTGSQTKDSNVPNLSEPLFSPSSLPPSTPLPTATSFNHNNASSPEDSPQQNRLHPRHHPPLPFRIGRDGGGTHSGAATPAEGFSDDSDYFPSSHLRPGPHRRQSQDHPSEHHHTGPSHCHHHHGEAAAHSSNSLATALKIPSTVNSRQSSRSRKEERKEKEARWVRESGMGTGARADALGDQSASENEDSHVDADDEGGPGKHHGSRGRGHAPRASEDKGYEAGEEEGVDGSGSGKDTSGNEALERVKREEERDRSFRGSVL